MISPPVRLPQRATSPGTYEIRLWISRLSFQTSFPNIWTSPSSLLMIPSSVRIVVDFPAPFGPIGSVAKF